MRAPSSRIAAVGVYLPETTRSTSQTEKEIGRANPSLKLATGLIHRLTGVSSVHVRAAGVETSDLAVEASKIALEQSAGEFDLIIFASASQDLIEPATSHILAAKLGATCPVMDIKNACNSMINGMQVADALIGAGQYRRVLVASGEAPTSGVRWSLSGSQQFLRAFPGYTMSDGGAAVILEATDGGSAGILDSSFHAVSSHWAVGTLPAGGSMFPRGGDESFFDMDGAGLQAAFLELGPQPVLDLLERNGWTWDDFDLVAIHQVALPSLPPIFERLGVASDKTVIVVADHGNLASVGLPLQLAKAREAGMVRPGSLVLLIGLAGGISLGLMAVQL